MREMKKAKRVFYNVVFVGRETGAIGIDYDIEESFVSDKELTEDEIRMKLYKKYEHIRILKINKIHA